ncbi:MAG TPA: glycosyltransferase [Pseudonocardiaceae bacterium]|nr:glycosyltransferase [Pseudonocardiaceae bacterium]
MRRFLFVVPPLVGHINPAASVADELRSRGHQIAWAGDEGILRPLLGGAAAGDTIYSCGLTAPAERPAQLRGFAALKYLWEDIFTPLAEAMEPGVRAAVAEFRPDLLVVDQQALAGALVAERLGLPWVTSASTSGEFIDPLEGMPKVQQWRQDQMRGLRERFGDPDAKSDLRFSPYLVLAFTTEAMVGETSGFDFPVSFVGPVRRPSAGGPSDPSLVFVSLGTMNTDSGARFLRECVAALRDRPNLRAIVVDPGGAITDAPPPHVVMERHVDQLAVLARASAVVCHGGHNTVCEALARGLPLVIAPIRDDQPVIAEQVKQAGAGLRLRFDRIRADKIGQAIDTVLTDPAYRVAAGQVQESFRLAGGAPAAADELSAVAG